MNRIWLIILPALLFLTSCGRPPELKVNDAIVKLSPVDSNPSALYFTVHGGVGEVDLIRVSTPSAIRVELHDTVKDSKTGMLSMSKLDRITIPASGKVEFKRGGKHVMLWGVNLVARRLEKIELEFLFSNGDRIIVTAPVEKIGAAETGDHNSH